MTNGAAAAASADWTGSCTASLNGHSDVQRNPDERNHGPERMERGKQGESSKRESATGRFIAACGLELVWEREGGRELHGLRICSTRTTSGEMNGRV